MSKKEKNSDTPQRATRRGGGFPPSSMRLLNARKGGARIQDHGEGNGTKRQNAQHIRRNESTMRTSKREVECVKKVERRVKGKISGLRKPD